MNTQSFREIGKTIGLVALGRDPLVTLGEMEAFNVESKDPMIKEAAVGLYRSCANGIAESLLKSEGVSQEYFLMKKLASQTDWSEEMVELLDPHFSRIVAAEEARMAEHDASFEKSAAPGLQGLATGLAGRAVTYSPSLMKALVAAGVTTGAVGGGLYWGMNRQINEDDDIENEKLKTKISEYDRMRKLLEEDMRNKRHKSLADVKSFAASY
jgi:hypothetical protein